MIAPTTDPRHGKVDGSCTDGKGIEQGSISRRTWKCMTDKVSRDSCDKKRKYCDEDADEGEKIYS